MRQRDMLLRIQLSTTRVNKHVPREATKAPVRWIDTRLGIELQRHGRNIRVLVRLTRR